MAAPLTIRFATDVESAKRGMADLMGSIAQNSLKTTSALRVVNDNLGRVQGAMATLPTAVKAAAGAFIAFEVAKLALAGIEALTKAAADQVERLAKLGSDASGFGVSTGFLQSMTAQARDLGLTTDAVTKSLQRLKEVSTVRQGEGGEDARNESVLEARLRLQQRSGNISAADVRSVVGAEDNEARAKALLELMQRLFAVGRDLAALDIGSQFLPADVLDRFRNSAVELDKFVTAAKTLRTVDIFDQELINRAQELDRRMKDAEHTLQRGLKPIYDALAQSGYALHESNVQWTEFLARRIPLLVDMFRSLQKAGADAAAATAGQPTSRDRAAAMGALVGRGIGRAAEGLEPIPSLPSAPSAEDAARERLRREMNPTSIAAAMRDSEARRKVFFPDKTNPNRTDKPKTGGGASAAESMDEIERFINTMNRQSDVLKAEFEALGKSNGEREKGIAIARLSAAARGAGRDATDAERQKVAELADAQARLNASLADGQQRLRENAEAMRHFGQLGVEAFSDMVLEGRSLDDVAANLTKTLARAALQAAVMGTGPLAGLLGTSAAASAGPNAIGGLLGGLGGLFGIGKNAGGTDNWRGGLSVVGERGPEIVNLPRGAQVIPNDVLRSGGRSGPSMTFAPSYSIDARGSQMSEGQFAAMLTARDAEINRTLGQRLAAWKQNN